MMSYLAVFLGGGIGALARYGISLLFARSSFVTVFTFPLSTLLINIVGSFALGFLYALTLFNGKLSPKIQLALTVGFCGAFTTFSTFALEIFNLIRDGALALAFLYVLASFLFGLIAVALGFFCARTLLS